jgi:hypothetical protein
MAPKPEKSTMLVSLVNKAPTLGYLFLSGSLEFSLVHFSGVMFSKGIEKPSPEQGK